MSYTNSNTTTGKIILQILLFGGVWLLIPLIFNDLDLNSYNFRRGTKILVGVTVIIIINIKWLLPKLYFQDKVGIYILSGIFLLIALYFCLEIFLDPLLETFRTHPPRKLRKGGRGNGYNFSRELNNLMPYLLAFIGSALFEISSFANRKTKEAMLLRSEKLETEMKLLKSQINPHFLFNALHNIYSLSYLKPEKTPGNLLKLSEMLRYMLYECNVDKVPLSKEIAYLENYIALKLLKDSRGMKVSVNLEKQTANLLIAPMLLIPFVENAFKHGNIEDLEEGWITIDLKTIQQKLIFKVTNSATPTPATKDEVGGIGLANVKRQLSLLYPNKHQLDIQSNPQQHTVQLEIDLI